MCRSLHCIFEYFNSRWQILDDNLFLALALVIKAKPLALDTYLTKTETDFIEHT